MRAARPSSTWDGCDARDDVRALPARHVGRLGDDRPARARRAGDHDGVEPVELQVGGRAVLLRQARRDDVAAVVRLLADDPMGRSRESGASGRT